MIRRCQESIRDRNRPDIIHIHNVWENLQHHTARAAFAAGVPYLIRPCGMLDPWSLRQSKWKKRIMLALRVRGNLSRAAAIHYTTATERDLARPLKLKRPAIVEPNGVLLEPEIRFTGDDLRRRFKLGPGPVVLFFARLHPKKGVRVLVDAFSRVLERWDCDNRRPTLLLAGPDESGTRAEIERQLASLPGRNQVLFTGLLNGDDKLMALQGSDLFALPSYQENFGISVVEALAGGTPVLISDQVNIYREIEAAGVGAATPVDAAAFANALYDWLTDTPRRSAAAAKAAEWAQTTYNWDTIANRWSEHYESLCSRT